MKYEPQLIFYSILFSSLNTSHWNDFVSEGTKSHFQTTHSRFSTKKSIFSNAFKTFESELMEIFIEIGHKSRNVNNFSNIAKHKMI